MKKQLLYSLAALTLAACGAEKQEPIRPPGVGGAQQSASGGDGFAIVALGGERRVCLYRRRDRASDFPRSV